MTLVCVLTASCVVSDVRLAPAVVLYTDHVRTTTAVVVGTSLWHQFVRWSRWGRLCEFVS